MARAKERCGAPFGSASAAFLFLVFMMSACTSRQLADEQKTNSVCETVKTSREWKYCFTPGSASSAGHVIYYFHGGGGSEFDWIDSRNYPKEIRQEWSKSKVDSPDVVAVSFGKMWLLASRSSRDRSGLYEVFKKEVVPYVESHILKSPVRERILIGESMGGFNAGTFALRNPQMFTKVAMVCPSVGTIDSASERLVDEYVRETGAKRRYASLLFNTRDEFFDSTDQANRESPYQILKSIPKGTPMPRFYLSVGDRDEFGFYYGAMKFVAQAEAKGLNVTWKPVSGGVHCSVDLPSLAKFLASGN